VDTLVFSGSSSGLILNLGLAASQFVNAGSNRLVLTGTLENVVGTAFADVVRGNAAANRVEGGGGNDILHGLGGDDELLGGAGDDLLDGGEGNDIVLGGAGRDTLLGADGRDLLFGGLGRDTLLGGSGDDLLFGGSVTFEADWPPLRAARDEWASARGYEARVQNLRDGTGSADRLNGTAVLTEATVTDDGEQDILIGGPDRD
jgi:Ca2+-binding RTX toxin-like protein